MLLPAALVALAVAMPATAFIARNDLVVEPLTATDFTIPYRGLSGATDFWCAAGDYVIRGLGLSLTTRIYRTSAPPRRAGEGVDFSLDRTRATAPGIVLLSSPDLGMSADFARQLCEGRELKGIN